MWHHRNNDADEEEDVDHDEDAVDGGGAEDPPPPFTEAQAEPQPLAEGGHATTPPNTPTASGESSFDTQFRMHREGAGY